jgi:hypothetical protein
LAASTGSARDKVTESVAHGGRFVDVAKFGGDLFDIFGVVIEGGRPVEQTRSRRLGHHPLGDATQFLGTPAPVPGPVEETAHIFETALGAAGSRSFVRQRSFDANIAAVIFNPRLHRRRIPAVLSR